MEQIGFYKISGFKDNEEVYSRVVVALDKPDAIQCHSANDEIPTRFLEKGTRGRIEQLKGINSMDKTELENVMYSANAIEALIGNRAKINLH